MIEDEHDLLHIGKHIEVLESPLDSETWESVRDPQQRQWKLSQQDIPNFGFTRSRFWMRFAIENRTGKNQTRFLEAAYSNYDEITFYQVDSGHIERTSMGDLMPFSQRPVPYKNFVLPLDIPAGKKLWVYLSCKTTGPVYFPLNLWTPTGFATAKAGENYLAGYYYGILLGLLGYNLFLWFGTRTRHILYYCCFLAALGLFQLSIHGFAFTYLWPNSPVWGNAAVAFFMGLAVFCMLVFSRNFLETTAHFPRLDRPILVLMALTLSALVLSVAGYYPIAIRVGTVSALVAALYLGLCGIYMSRKGLKHALYYTASFASFLLGILVNTFKFAGLIPETFFTEYAIQMGSALQVILLSIASGAKIRYEQLLAQRAIQELNSSLEKTLGQVKHLNQELIEKEAARTLFFHNTSHELRTPLNGIIGFLDLVRRGQLGSISQQAASYVNKSLRLADSLKIQVNTILDLAKSRKGEHVFRYQTIDLAFLKEEIDQLAESLTLRSKHLSYHSVLTGDQTTFISDRDKIFSILRNLVGNAMKFSQGDRPNHVELQIEVKEHRLSLEVKDTGIGIPREYLDKIFEEFTQVQGDARRKFEGTGLGLTIVRDFARALGGDVVCTSELGKGSCFRVYVTEADATAIDLVAPDREEADALPDFIPDAKTEAMVETSDNEVDSGDIYVLDDNETNCEVLSGILTACGYRARSQESAELALEQMRKDKPQLLLLDMMMPEMSGEDVIKTMKADPLLNDIPIILITARASDQDRIEGLRMGADDYLAKPIFAAELRLRVRNMLDRHRLLQEQASHAGSEKLSQLGELFAELSHELKNILHSSMTIQKLSSEDSGLSLAVLSLDESLRKILAQSLIEPSQPLNAIERMNLFLEDGCPEASTKELMLLQSYLVELDLSVQDLMLVWKYMAEAPVEEQVYASTQVKIFTQYKALLATLARCRELTQTVLHYTRDPKVGDLTNLPECWHRLQVLTQARWRKFPVTLQVDLKEESVAIASQRLTQVLMNLTLNALDAMEHLDRDNRWLRISSVISSQTLIVTVENGGPPIPGDIQQKLFRRGFSTKGQKGNGIGLSTSLRYIQEVGGSLRYCPEAANPCFQMVLPLYQDAPTLASGNKAPA